MDEVRHRLGSRVRLRFAARTRGRSALVPVWGDPTLFARRPARDGRRPNVLLVSLDTLRADHLGFAGFPGGVSPHLDRLAGEGTVFTDAVTLVNWTLPSHATMLTGVDPCGHGFRGALSGPGPRRLPPAVVPLAESLRRKGWMTAAFTENGYVLPVVFRRGFDRFDAAKHPQGGIIEDTTGRALAWLREHAASEFFLFVHTYQVHAPYTPPEPYRSAFADADATLPKAADAAGYTGEVAFTDAVIGRFLATLDALGLRDWTIVIVTSDHGESFGERGVTGHGMSLHEEETRVPLVWRAPGMVRAGARVDDLVSLGDLVPTVSEMLGLPASPLVTGRSVYGTMRVDGRTADRPPERALILEGMAARAVRAKAWKSIFRGAAFTVFDLDADPAERAPRRLVHHPPSEAAFAEHDALCERLRGRAGVPEEESGEPIDPGLTERLRALGYLH
jgi:arylsulfatase A-like enzyme